MSRVAQSKESPKARALRELRELREVFAHSDGAQDGLSVWWQSLDMNARRLVLAFVGIDDSEKAAARPWRQFLQEHRDAIVFECRKFGRIVAPLRLWEGC